MIWSGFINDRNSMLTGRVALDIGGADVQNVLTRRVAGLLAGRTAHD